MSVDHISPDRQPTATGAGLTLASICMEYGDVRAVDNVSLDIEPGQFVTLLGASGSGKTTLLRTIAGFLEPTAGQVFVDGADLTHVPVHKRNIGMVFQSYALFPHMTVEKNVAFPLAMRRMRKAERQALAQEALASVHLPDYGNRMPHQLSGGQQQRVALARAIVSKPSLLLMDEPLGALDRRLREAMQIEILRLSRELGLTVINVTHDQEEAFTMSDRIALLAGGKLVQYASPEDIYTKPVSSVAAEFLGEANLYSGVLTQSAHGMLELGVDAGQILVAPHTTTGAAAVAGRSVALVVRPWVLGIEESAPGSAAPADRCWLDGRLAAIIYAGDSQKLVVDRPDGAQVIVRRPMENKFVAEPGADVRVTWAPQDAIVTELG